MTATLMIGWSYTDIMEWKGRAKATVSTRIVEPKAHAYIMKTIRFDKPININFENQDLSCEPNEDREGPKERKKIKTDFGVIWIHSRNCIQISHVKNPDNMEKLERFIHNVLFKKETNGFVEWLKRQDEKFERDLKGE